MAEANRSTNFARATTKLDSQYLIDMNDLAPKTFRWYSDILKYSVKSIFLIVYVFKEGSDYAALNSDCAEYITSPY